MGFLDFFISEKARRS